MSLVHVGTNLPTWLDPLEVVFDDLYSWIEVQVQDASRWVLETLLPTLKNINDTLWDFSGVFWESLKSIIQPILDTLIEMDIPLISDITGVINHIYVWIDDSVEAIRFSMQNITSLGFSSLGKALGYLRTDVFSRIDEIPTLMGGAFGNIVDGVQDVLSGKMDGITGGIGGLVESMISAFAQGFREVLPDLFSFGEFLIDMLKDGILKLKDAVIAVLEPLFFQGVTTISDFLSSDSPPASYEDTMKIMIARVFETTSSYGTLEKTSMPEWSEVRNKALGFASLMSVGIAGSTILGMGLDATHPAKHWQFREAFSDIFDVLLPQVAVGSVLQMPFEVGTLRFLQYHLQADHRPTIPQPNDLLAMFHKGWIDNPLLTEYMGYHGFPDLWTEHLIETTRILPSPSDLIRFVVKEVISPDVFTDIMQRHGYAQDHARMYWNSHWDLPSMSQVLAMFHRNIDMPIITLQPDGQRSITMATSPAQRLEALDKFLVLADFAEEWRTPIREISYNIITRVDARRAWELGVIGDTDLVDIMRRNGYSPDDAILVAEAQKLEVMTAERNELINRIGDLYVKGWINSSLAVAYLAELDIKDVVIEMQVSAWDFEQYRTKQEEYLSIFLKQYHDDVIDEGEVTGYLNGLGLEQWRIRTEIMYIKAKRGEKIDFRQETIS